MERLKCRKQDEQQDVNFLEDKFSNLPDSVIQHILSLIPTKDAVATCILSRRWKYLWTSVPSIVFEDPVLCSIENLKTTEREEQFRISRFMNFVERVLLLHDCSNLNKFSLSCRDHFDPSRAHSWISAAIKRNVQELDLCLFVQTHFTLPSTTFCNKTLTSAKIVMTYDLELPFCISLPHLKTLHLALVTFLDDDSTQRLFSGCPSLENLICCDCEWMNLKLIRISIPSLKSLIIDDLPCFGAVDKLNVCQIMIAAENVKNFKYSGYLLNEICPCNLSSVADASFNMPVLPEMTAEIAHRAFKLLTGLRSVKSLKMSASAFQCLFLVDTGTGKPPIFQNLTYLELNFIREKQIIQKLVDFLGCTPNLESLVFAEGFDSFLSLDDGGWILNPVPNCISCRLKSVSLHNFSGSPTEMYVLESLLESAPMLERVIVGSSKDVSGDSKKKNDLGTQLMMLSRASTSCKLSFV